MQSSLPKQVEGTTIATDVTHVARGCRGRHRNGEGHDSGEDGSAQEGHVLSITCLLAPAPSTWEVEVVHELDEF